MIISICRLIISYQQFLYMQVFITKSYDATSHFETTCADVIQVFERAYGGKFDYDKVQNTDHEM